LVIFESDRRAKCFEIEKPVRLFNASSIAIAAARLAKTDHRNGVAGVGRTHGEGEAS
jgi:hypothetical protein